MTEEQVSGILEGKVVMGSYKDLRTIGRAIKKLRDNERLMRVGSAKDGYWKLLSQERE